jgi:hypothetical protein
VLISALPGRVEVSIQVIGKAAPVHYEAIELKARKQRSQAKKLGMRPSFLKYREKKCCGQAKQNRAVQCF